MESGTKPVIPPTKNNYLASVKITYTVNKVGNIKGLKKFVISSSPAYLSPVET
jgi:hypothetical protein